MNDNECPEVVEHSVELVECTPMASLQVAIAARTCYRSEKPMTISEADDFVKMLIRKGHESPLEFAHITLRITTSRDITHELVRHRLASYAQESTRYVRYKHGVQKVRPVEIKEYLDDGTPNPAYLVWLDGCRAAEKAYIELLRITHRPEIARTVLPGSTRTTIMMQMNMREFRHFLRLRMAPAAHPDMRYVASLCHVEAVQHGLGIFLEDLQLPQWCWQNTVKE